MKRLCFLALSLVLLLALSGVAQATNGDNLIGIGPISRAMGGVGVAAPQDPISAVFANPAAMCFGPYCPGSEFNFTGTIFNPKVKARVQIPGYGIDVSNDSQHAPFAIPAIGISSPINLKWRFGLAAYGVSGMGVDYRNELSPLGGYSLYQVMKFAPNIAYLVNDNFSVGASLHIDYAALDFAQGTSHNYTAGIQLGAIYKFEPFSFGISYVTPQEIKHERVYDFDGDGTQDDLKLEMPQTIAGGIAVEPLKDLLIEADIKWLNWSDATGYKDFDWDDQWVYAIGVQYKPTKALALRAGFNYAENPVNLHNGFDGSTTTSIQGKTTGTFNYEYLRIIAFPAVAESHLTLGIGYQISERLSVNLGYMHAFEKTITETGQNVNLGAGPSDATLTSELSEDSYEFGISWRF